MVLATIIFGATERGVAFPWLRQLSLPRGVVHLRAIVIALPAQNNVDLVA